MNKVLIKVYVPYIGEEYDVFIPVNRKIGTVKKYIINTIYELSNGNLKNINKIRIYDKQTGEILNNNMYIKESNIRNGTKLILL